MVYSHLHPTLFHEYFSPLINILVCFLNSCSHLLHQPVLVCYNG